jgi:hypothetical protein
MSESLDQSFRVRSEFVSAERVDGDVIAVNLRTGSYFSLSGSAADIWTAATSGSRSWCASLDSAFGEPVPRDEVLTFITRCEEMDLIQAVASAPLAGAPSNNPPELPDDWPRGEWQSPVLEVFDDLRDLILVDPIHDASALGWPRIESMDDPERA